jgi:hypothetical protein
MEGFAQTGEMQADDDAVRIDKGIDFSENDSPMQLRKGIGGTGNGQVNGRIGGESDVETFGKAGTKVVTVVFAVSGRKRFRIGQRQLTAEGLLQHPRLDFLQRVLGKIKKGEKGRERRQGREEQEPGSPSG